ncbi:hypothetical protein TTHERM_000494689 (macronuclear) [Tetrahymena thermophila SB210]|uniref:Uncharacterized protein n=1 Tax=Tetrahymena thermophila (strain SB210) TaxID=312017 RepID=W7WZW4_TETTS|nr:hypothetical protein TTHERM_000494689 [Tetrahymena thermophila SB210]EWS72395.1 hypothetical protein TTHERM_000494689 [Tetrahymena thermophila SB210]|eukprot:XP_012655079.1 hypothetical protein TTHERM_000494689 [Tetrahymena thermophila SB210]
MPFIINSQKLNFQITMLFQNIINQMANCKHFKFFKQLYLQIWLNILQFWYYTLSLMQQGLVLPGRKNTMHKIYVIQEIVSFSNIRMKVSQENVKVSVLFAIQTTKQTKIQQNYLVMEDTFSIKLVQVIGQKQTSVVQHVNKQFEKEKMQFIYQLKLYINYLKVLSNCNQQETIPNNSQQSKNYQQSLKNN